MKKIIILIFIFFSSIILFAQKGKEKIQALKIAYLTEKLELTTQEAQKFWPLYNDHDKKRKELFNYEKKELKDKLKEGYTLEDISDQEADNILKKIYQYREERHKEKLAFHKELMSILSSKKILLLELTEREFNRKLMRKFRDEKEPRNN